MLVVLVDMPIKRGSAIAALAGLEDIFTERGPQPNLSAGIVPPVNMLLLQAMNAFPVLQERTVPTKVCHHTKTVHQESTEISRSKSLVCLAPLDITRM